MVSKKNSIASFVLGLVLVISLVPTIQIGSFRSNSAAMADRDSFSPSNAENALFASTPIEATDKNEDTSGNITATASVTVPLGAQSTVVAKSGSNRYVVWSDHTPGNFDVFFRRSTDSGATWKSAVNLSNNAGLSASVIVASSGSNVYVAWTQYNLAQDHADIYVRASTDNGATWGGKIKLSTSGENVNVHPQVAASGSNAYVVWNEAGDDIVLRRSIDSGATWKAEIPISNNDDRSAEPQVAASGSNVYVFWQYDVPSTANLDIMFRRSTDSGATWKSAVNLSKNGGKSELPHIAVAGSNVYVVWTDPSPGNPEIMFKGSTNGGISWGITVNISDNKGISTRPQIAASGANVYVGWEQNNIPPTLTDVLVRASTDNGATWGGKIKLSTSGENHDSIPQLAASGSNAYVVWNEAGDDIVLRRSIDSGATWKAEIPISNNQGTSDTAYVVSSGSGVFVVWDENTSGNYEIMFKRSTDSGATWKSTVNLSNNPEDSFLIVQPT